MVMSRGVDSRSGRARSDRGEVVPRKKRVRIDGNEAAFERASEGGRFPRGIADRLH